MSYHFPAGTGVLGAEIRRNADIVGFGMLLFFGGSFFVYEAVYRLAALFFSAGAFQPGTELFEEAISLTAYVIVMTLPVLAVAVFTRIPIKTAFPMNRPDMAVLAPGVLLCLGVSVFGGFFSSLLSEFLRITLGIVPIMPDMPIPESGTAVCVYIASTVVAPAFLEEMLFRGVVLQSLRRFGDAFALVTSSILFSMAHGNLVQGPNSLLMGLAIGYFVLYTGSLWSGVVIHFVNNGIIAAFELVMRHATQSAYTRASAQLTWSYVFCGVLALVILLPRNPGLFRLTPPELIMPRPKKYTVFFTSVMPVAVIAAAIFITLLNFAPA